MANRNGVPLWVRGLNALGACLFALAVVVQHNDPDPWLWGSIYGLVALLCVAATLDRLPHPVTTLALFGYLALALAHAPYLLESSAAVFDSVSMQNLQHEQVREAWGVLLCFLWVLGLWWHTRHRVMRSRR